MRSTLSYIAILVFSCTAFAQSLRPYQTGKLLEINAVPCSVSHSNSQQPLCQQLVIESDGVVFHIRPKREKQPVLLPVGERAQFRIEKGNILLHMDGVDSKEREFIVVSIAPRSDSSTADATPARLNHLQ